MDFGLSKETLSSGLTFFYKFIFPALWIGGFGLRTVALLFSSPGKAGGFLLAFLAGCLMFYFFCLPLKTVELDHKYLYVSNYRKTIRISVSKIESVVEVPFINIHPIWIRFKSSTAFGRTIVFMPYFHIGSVLMMPHPVATKLRKLVGPTIYV